MSTPKPVIPTFEAQTFQVHFHSHTNPELLYTGILDTWGTNGFSIISAKSPSVGHHVVFSFYNGKEKFLQGTAKIKTITARTGDSVQIDLDLIQADPHAIAHLDSIFQKRQENIQNWVHSLRET